MSLRALLLRMYMKIERLLPHSAPQALVRASLARRVRSLPRLRPRERRLYLPSSITERLQYCKLQPLIIGELPA
jgi:hypothetical protein